MATNLSNFTDILGDIDEICDSQASQPLSFPSSNECRLQSSNEYKNLAKKCSRPPRGTGQYKDLRSVEEIDPKYRDIFTYPFFNIIQSRVIDDALYSDKSMVVCAPTGSGKTVVFEMAIAQLLMEIEDKCTTEDFKIIYMAPVKALCTERLTEWYSKFTRLGLLCIEVTGDTDVDFAQLHAYRVIITTPEKWDMLTRRWRDYRGMVEMIKLFLIDEVHILNDETRGPVLETVVSRMKTIQSSAQAAYRIEKLQKQYKNKDEGGVIDLSGTDDTGPRIRFVAVSATVSNPEDVAAWLGTDNKPAVHYKFGDECRPVKLKRVVEGYPCADGTSIFKFDIILNYKLWPIIQKYHDGKPTLIFCNTRKSVVLTAETLSREITITFSPDQQAKLTALASTIKNKKLQSLVLIGVGCHHAGLLYEERTYIEQAFRNGDLPILITTTTLAMGVNLPAHLVIIKNTQQYVNGAYQEYSISTVLQMVGRAGRPQFDTEATAVIMTRQKDKARYQALAGGSEPLQSYLHKRLAENLNSETALGTVGDVAQCVEWLRSTFLYVRAAKDPKKYLSLTAAAPEHLILKKIEELCVIAMNGLRSAGLITMDEASCIASTEAGRLMSLYYLDLETMKHIMKIQGNESLERLLWIICECHELADMHLRTDERRCLNALNRNNTAATIRFPLKGKITTRQMKLSCIIQAVLGCLPIPDPSLYQEAMKIMRIADRICKCLVAYVTRPEPISQQLQYYSVILNAIILAKCVSAHLWENSPYVSKQLKGIGPTFSTLLATAGKHNFMLLEESHPRDLERIMNKGAPAGNILRKQISLLPKYQLTTTPIDEKTVSIKLLLLNQSFLAENIENLTAGTTHRCYFVVGDSENHILVLRSFTDKDLISVYDGCMEHNITRKRDNEHKIFIHCISSSFAGIDVQCEYTFTSLFTSSVVPISSQHFSKHDNTSSKQAMRQGNVKTITKERKRKNPNEEIAQSKEKKKRDNALAEKFKLLKESFGRTSSNLKMGLQKAQGILDNTSNNFAQSENAEIDVNIDHHNINLNSNISVFNDDFMDDAKIDSILNEIESEITKSTSTTTTENNIREINIESSKTMKSNYVPSTLYQPKNQSFPGKRINKAKSNYTFLELLEKNTDLSDSDDVTPEKDVGGFSETIKSHIEKYITNNCKTTDSLDISLKQLCQKDLTSDQRSTEINEIHVRMHDTDDFIKHKTNEICVPEKGDIDVDDYTDNYYTVLNENQNNSKTSSYIDLDKDEIVKPKYELNYELLNILTSNQKSSKIGLNNTEDSIDIVKSDLLPSAHTLLATEYKMNDNCEDYSRCSESNYTIADLSRNSFQTTPKLKLKYELPLATDNDVLSSVNQIPLVNQELSSDTVVTTDVITPIDQELSLTSTNMPALTAGRDELFCASINELTMPQLATEFPLYSINTPSKTNSSVTQLKNIANSDLNSYYHNKNDFIPSNNKYLEEVANLSEYKNNTDQCTFSKIKPKEHIKGNDQEWENKLASNNNEDGVHVENYSYSTEKLDIQTRFTNEHKIHIIRRLKVDLDVRKVVSNLGSNVKLNKEREERSSTVGFTDDYKHREEYKDQQSLKDDNQGEKKSKNLEIIKDLPEYNQCCEESDQMIDEQKTSVKGEDINLFGDIKADGPEINENYNDQKSNPENEELLNILQKYSKIIGDSLNRNAKLTSSVTSNEMIKSKQKFIKPNRPFKISDIQHLNVTLPSLECNNVATANSNGTVEKQKCTNDSENINKDTCTSNCINVITESAKENSEDETHEDLEPTILCPYTAPLSIDKTLELSPPDNDFQIDQYMLNPKTLLQTLRTRDDEIIPPPAEFGNDTIFASYSPDPGDNVNTADLMDNVGSFGETQESEFYNNHYELDQSSSKEMVTSISYSNDDIVNSIMSQTSPNRFNINQNESLHYQDSSNINIRQGCLSSFKFSRKKKLKFM